MPIIDRRKDGPAAIRVKLIAVLLLSPVWILVGAAWYAVDAENEFAADLYDALRKCVTSIKTGKLW